jgi:23S rRNA (pseudouridine1915-N3)-methyltransferase
MSGGLLVLSVGRTRRGPLAELEQDYLDRIGREAPVRHVSVPAARERRPAERRRREGRALLERLPARGVTVALDERGRAASSPELANRLVRWREQGEVAFVVGGPDGLDAPVLAAADHRLSLSRMTLPHELALVVLLEQVYRALLAQAGHPYASH